MSDADLRIEDAVNETCPWSGKPIAPDALTIYRDVVVGFCNPGCRDKFEAGHEAFRQGHRRARRAADGQRSLTTLAKVLRRHV